MPWQRSERTGDLSTVPQYGGPSEKIGRSILWSIAARADRLATLALDRVELTASLKRYSGD